MFLAFLCAEERIFIDGITIGSFWNAPVVLSLSEGSTWRYKAFKHKMMKWVYPISGIMVITITVQKHIKRIEELRKKQQKGHVMVQ